MTRRQTRLVHEGEYVAEIEVVLTDSEEGTGWGPYLSLDEARKLDAVRRALKQGDLKAAAQFGRVFKLMPVAV